MEEVAARLPDKRGAELLGSYLDMLRRSAPDKAAAFEAKLVGKPMGKAIKEYAAKQEQAQAAWREARLRRMADLGTIKFTASDGREVDLAKLRGKVVLVDFWATWCEPCIEEIPDIVATYQKYHDRGFEVIGITLENAGVAEGDGAEAREKKLKTAKEKMEAFAKKNNMPWPQYFDGLYASNQFVMKYDIRGIGIPATFLLDKDGKVASTEARGAKLEAEVKRLLGL
jgi:thiol-disulfide isomerase/thioredoxin